MTVKRKWIKHNKKEVGFIFDDPITEKRVYVTTRKRFYFFNGLEFGFSISTDILTITRQNNVDEIRIILYKPDGSTSVFKTDRRAFDNGKVNYYGLKDKQRFVAVKNFRISGKYDTKRENNT